MAKVDDKVLVNPDVISLRELLSQIKKWTRCLQLNWKTIIAAGLVGSMIGLSYSYIKKPLYKAELSFALEDDNSSGVGKLGAAAGIASQLGVDLMGGGVGGAFSGDNLLELMKSRSMIQNALLTPVDINNKTQTLAEVYISFNKFRVKDPDFKDIHFFPGVDQSKFTLKQDSVLGIFYKLISKENLVVDKVDKNLSIITIKVNSTNELFSKYFAESLVKTVSDFYVATKTKKEALNVSILQHQTDSVRRELNAALSGVASSSDVNPNANPALQILRVQSERRQVDVEANTAILTELVKNLEISKVSLRKETPLIQIVDKPILPLFKDKPSRLISTFVGGIIFVIFASLFVIFKARIREINIK